MLSGSLLVAGSLGRSFRAHRSRAISAVGAGALGVALTTAILVLTGAVTSAIQGASWNVPAAQWVASARSSSGMSDQLIERAGAVPGVELAPIVRVSTRLSGSGDPLLVVGVTPALAAFVPPDPALGALVESLTTAPGGVAGDGLAVVASRSWAEARDLQTGSDLRVDAPGGVIEARIVGLIDGSLLQGDNVLLAGLPAVASAFDRVGVTDAVLVRSARADQSAVREEVDRAFGGAASVTRPEDSATSYERSFKSVRTILSLFAFMSALIAATVVFFCWQVTLEDARPSVARLRLVGAGRAVLGSGAAVVLVPVVVLSALIGAPIGLALGARLSGFTNDLVKLTQLGVEPQAPLLVPALGGAVVALAVFAVALGSSVRTFTKVAVIDAVQGGRR